MNDCLLAEKERYQIYSLITVKNQLLKLLSVYHRRFVVVK